MTDEIINVLVAYAGIMVGAVVVALVTEWSMKRYPPWTPARAERSAVRDSPLPGQFTDRWLTAGISGLVSLHEARMERRRQEQELEAMERGLEQQTALLRAKGMLV